VLSGNRGPFLAPSHDDLQEGITEPPEPDPVSVVEAAPEVSTAPAIVPPLSKQGSVLKAPPPVIPDLPPLPQFTRVDYVRHVCIAIILFVRAECFQSAVDTAIKLWTFILNKWLSPKQFGSEMISIKRFLNAMVDSLVTLAEIQCSATQSQPDDVYIIAREYSHPRDIKENLYLLKDPVVFFIKVLCLMKENKDAVEFGSRIVEVAIYHAPEYAKIYCDGIMSFLYFAQDEIIADALEKVGAREQKLNDFIAAYEEAQAKKRKKKLRIARLEKSDEELQYEMDCVALKDKLSRAKAVHEASCNRKEALKKTEKRVEGINTTGQQLFDNVHKSALQFISQCRENLITCDEEGGEHIGKTTFSQLLAKSRPMLKKYEELVDHYDQVAQFLRDKKDRMSLLSCLHEQGDLMVMFDKANTASAVWRDAVDGLFNVLDAWKEWRPLMDRNLEHIDPVVARSSLSVAVVLAKLSRHCTTGDFDLKSNYCQLAAKVCLIPFREGIGHPQDLCGFAAYSCVELGGKSPLEFNTSAFNAFSFQTALEEVIRVLGHDKLQLQALPVITLLEHFHGYYTRRVDKWVEARFQRIQFLIDLHLFAEAASMLATCLPTMQSIRNCTFHNPLLSVRGGGLSSDKSRRLNNVSINGLDYNNCPPYFNNIPPDSQPNQDALAWIQAFPESFAAAAKEYIFVLVPVVKTAEQLAEEERIALETAAAAAAEAAKNKGKKGKEKDAEKPISPRPVGPPAKPLFTNLHLAEAHFLVALFMIEIRSLDSRTTVPHNAYLNSVAETSAVHLSKVSQLLSFPLLAGGFAEQKSDPPDNEQMDKLTWSNSAWTSLHSRARILQVRQLLLKREYSKARALLLALVKVVRSVAHLFGDAKYEITQFWFLIKYYVILVSNAQARCDDSINTASQSAKEASLICCGRWFRDFISARAQVSFKLGDIASSEADCQAVINSYSSSQLVDMGLVKVKLLSASIHHSKSLNVGFDEAVKQSALCLTHVRDAVSKAESLSRDRGYRGADINSTYEFTTSMIHKHDQFPPFRHTQTSLYSNYPATLAFSKFREKTGESVSTDLLVLNGYLRPGPVDGNAVHPTSPLCNIYLEEIRMLTATQAILCTILDDLRLANIPPPPPHPVGDESLPPLDLSSGILLKEQLVTGEEALKVLAC
jgi:hypothetical protein